MALSCFGVVIMVRFLMVIAVGFVTTMSSQVLASECFYEDDIQRLNRGRGTNPGRDHISGRTASCVISESKILGQSCETNALGSGSKQPFDGIGFCRSTIDGEHAGHKRWLQIIHPDLGFLNCKIAVWYDKEYGHTVSCVVYGSTVNSLDNFAYPPLKK